MNRFYYAGWALQVSACVQAHAVTLEEWTEPTQPVHRFEAVRLFVVSGWRDE